MRFPIIVIGYGSFETNNKLFFYEIGGLGCLPIFTEPVMAAAFCASATERMGDMLIGKPPLTNMTCSKREYFLDMLQVISTLVPDVQIIELNPYPLTDKYKQKLREAKIKADSQKYSISEMVEMIQNEITRDQDHQK